GSIFFARVSAESSGTAISRRARKLIVGSPVVRGGGASVRIAHDAGEVKTKSLGRHRGTGVSSPRERCPGRGAQVPFLPPGAIWRRPGGSLLPRRPRACCRRTACRIFC